MDVPFVAIPAFSHFSNVVVFPASNRAQGESLFFLLNKTATVPKPSGKKLWVETPIVLCFAIQCIWLI